MRINVVDEDKIQAALDKINGKAIRKRLAQARSALWQERKKSGVESLAYQVLLHDLMELNQIMQEWEQYLKDGPSYPNTHGAA